MTAPQWTGSPAEWDAELERRACVIQDQSNFALDDDAVVRWARATMPPRPVEPPNIVTASGWTVTWDDRDFLCSYGVNSIHATVTRSTAHSAAAWCSATESEHDAIRALRDGPTARYEVCGWEHWRGNKYVQTFHVNDNRDAESCKQSVQFEIIQSGGGGTAHAIYKRVGGA